MAVALFKDVVMTGLQTPTSPRVVVGNTIKVSVWGTLGSGAGTLVFFIFSKTFMQEGPYKEVASHVFKATLVSCATFASFAVYCIYKAVMDSESDIIDSEQKINERVSLSPKWAAGIGLFGAAAAFLVSKLDPSNTLKQRALFPLFLGLGIAGSILSIFKNRQTQKLNDHQAK